MTRAIDRAPGLEEEILDDRLAPAPEEAADPEDAADPRLDIWECMANDEEDEQGPTEDFVPRLPIPPTPFHPPKPEPSASAKAILAGDGASLRLALDHGQNPDELGADGSSLVFLACEAGREECLALLLLAGADPDRVHRWRSTAATPAAAAAEGGHESCLRVLGAHGANLHLRDARGQTALGAACSTNQEACIRALIEMGCHPDEVGRDGLTLLMRAAADGAEASAMALAAFGSSLDLRDAQGRSAADWARANAHDGIGSWLDALRNSRSEKAALDEASSIQDLAQSLGAKGRPRI